MFDNATLRQAQMIMLDILVEVDRICKINNLTYWFDGGTLLGAVRHKGFIPWDDDLDISMPIEDYLRFCQIAMSELPDGLFLQTKETDSTYPYDCAKVRSNQGTIIEKHEMGKDVSYNQGIFIDIFPSIRIKETRLEKMKHKSLLLFIKLFSYKYLNISTPRNWLISIHDSMHAESNPIDVRSGMMPELVYYVPVRDILPTQKMEFEKKYFSVPIDPASYLKSLYGSDYMTLPPKNKRYTHAHEIIIKEDQ